jgi:hypothetical protein
MSQRGAVGAVQRFLSEHYPGMTLIQTEESTVTKFELVEMGRNWFPEKDQFVLVGHPFARDATPRQIAEELQRLPDRLLAGGWDARIELTLS